MKAQLSEEQQKQSEASRLSTTFTTIIQSWRGKAFIGLTLIIIAVILYSVFTRDEANEDIAKTTTDTSGVITFLMEQQWRIRMKLALVEEKTVARQITATGRIIPAANQHADVAPAISGLIERGPLPRLGQRITAGQTVAVLRQIVTSADQSQIRAAQSQAQAQDAQVSLDAARIEAELRTADGEIESAQARLEQAQRDAERALKLHEQQVLPKQEAERAVTLRKTAQADYDAAIKRRNVLNNVRKHSPVNSARGGANTTQIIRAPISGLITKVSKNLGEQVAAGESILEITNLDTVWVEAPVFERDIGLLSNNMQATFTTAAYPEREFQGLLIDLGDVIDENKRAAMVVFSVPNPGHSLRIGMQADVRLNASESITAMMIPREAVVEDEGKKIVYVQLSGEEFQRREVKLGDEYGDKVAVLYGLKSGERVVTQGALQLKLQELNPAGAPTHTHET